MELFGHRDVGFSAKHGGGFVSIGNCVHFFSTASSGSTPESYQEFVEIKIVAKVRKLSKLRKGRGPKSQSSRSFWLLRL